MASPNTWKESCCFIGFAELRIKQYAFWSWVLHPDQDPFIGRSIIYLSRHEVNILNTTQEERDELFQIFSQATHTLTELFHPDRFNYAQLGNNPNFHHLHWHFVPRYNQVREFNGKVYDDIYRGDSFDLHDSSVSTPPKTNTVIAEKIRQQVTLLPR